MFSLCFQMISFESCTCNPTLKYIHTTKMILSFLFCNSCCQWERMRVDAETILVDENEILCRRWTIFGRWNHVLCRRRTNFSRWNQMRVSTTNQLYSIKRNFYADDEPVSADATWIFSRRLVKIANPDVFFGCWFLRLVNYWFLIIFWN